MKRCLQWRHQSTLKTIVCTFRRKHRSAKLTPSAYCAPAPHSAAQSWSLSQSQNLGAPICSLWSLESRSMARVLLMQRMLLAIRRMSGEFFCFQQDSAPAHRARDTIELLRQETPDFIGPDLWPANSPDLNPVDYRIWGSYRNASTRRLYGASIT